MPNLTEHAFSDAQEAARHLAAAIAGRLAEAIAARGVATLALSGGRSPVPLFEALQDAALPWDKVIVAQVDERWVPADHEDSNARLIRTHLLRGPATAARFVPMKNEAADPRAGRPECEAAMATLPLPFDVTLLGMGDDGHTASLFPEATQLAEALSTQALTIAMTPPAAPHERMSLSRAGLLNSQLLILQIGGAGKQAVYRAALAPGPVEALPVRVVLHQDRVPIEVWIND
ncbi:MAG: 6-phosphogluconolactonase [Sphingobium sp.]